MYTKARIAGHPIHPALIAFPVALYTATVVGLIVFGGTHDGFWYRAAMWTNLAGVIMAGVAAIPGAIDLFTMPRHTRAFATGVKHAAFNVLALVLFIVSAVMLWRGYHSATNNGIVSLPYAAPLVLSIIGLASTVVAGALGWTLVQTHHVGIRPTEYGVARPADEIDDLDELAVPATRVTAVEEEVIVRH
jgi:uncharacterized membrane protein